MTFKSLRSLGSTSRSTYVSPDNARCQKCLQSGHWTADCTNKPAYKSRPSRSQLLRNPALAAKVSKRDEPDLMEEREKVVQEVLSKYEEDEIEERPLIGTFDGPPINNNNNDDDDDDDVEEEKYDAKPEQPSKTVTQSKQLKEEERFDEPLAIDDRQIDDFLHSFRSGTK